MIKRYKALYCLGGLIASQAINAAAVTAPPPQVATWRPVLSLSIGPTWSSQGSTQTLYLMPDIFKTYVSDGATSAFATGEVFFAGQRRLSHGVDIQVGLLIAASGDKEFRGAIWDDGDPRFDNYSYHYLAHQIRVAAKVKLSKSIPSYFQVYTAASLGLGLNHAHDYNSQPTIPQAVPMPNFADDTQSSASYSLELGVQQNINHHWVFGAGYQFVDWGKLSLARAPAQTVGAGLREQHLYTHSAQFTLSYLA